MYDQIRILMIILFIILIMIFHKKYIKNLKHKRISLLVLILFTIVIYIIPIENAFISFDSPEHAFEYSYRNKSIIDKMEYDGNAVIIYEFGDQAKISFLSSTKTGWKIESPYMPKNLFGNHYKDFNGVRVDALKRFDKNIYYLCHWTVQTVASRPEINPSYQYVTYSFGNTTRMDFYGTYATEKDGHYYSLLTNLAIE